MFDWLFPPSCPCDPSAKEWVEERLDWLADEFDDSAFNGRRIVLPTPDFFPSRYDGSEEAVRELLDQVCEYMDVIPDLVDLEIVAGDHKVWLVNEAGAYLPGAPAGTYQEEGGRFLIRIDRSNLAEPMDLVGTIAHELAHVRLLGEGRASSEQFDNEILTDLTVVHFGLGIFLANSPRNWESGNSRWPGTRLIKPEYLSPPMFGWALAHLAWFRGETKPAWARALIPAARANLHQGIRYLNATSDSTYLPLKVRRAKSRE